MISGQIACPYCNSRFSPAGPLPASRRLSCPRCGESFPYRGAEREIAVPQDSPPVPPWEPRRWSNRAIGGTVLAVMGAMMAVSLTAALLTEHVRREHDVVRPERRPPLSFPLVLLLGSLVYFLFLMVHLFRVLRGSASHSLALRTMTRLALLLLTVVALADGALIVAKTSAWLGWTARRAVSVPAEPSFPPVLVTAPAQLEGLGYLPPGTNAVAALHVAQAARTPAGRAFLDRSQLAGSGVGLATIEKATGLSREQIDHVVLGVRLDDSLSPVLVARTRLPFDAAKVRAALKARRRAENGKKELYDFPLSLSKLSLSALLWCPTDRTLVVTLAPSLMEKLPSDPAAGAERLVPPLREFLKKHVPFGVDAWAVGQGDDDGMASSAIRSFLFPADDRNVLAAIRAFGFWLRLDETIDLNAVIECVDAAGAETLEKRWNQREENEADYLKILGGGEGGEQVSRALKRTLQVKQRNQWVTLEATADAKTVRNAVGGR